MSKTFSAAASNVRVAKGRVRRFRVMRRHHVRVVSLDWCIHAVGARKKWRELARSYPSLMGSIEFDSFKEEYYESCNSSAWNWRWGPDDFTVSSIVLGLLERSRSGKKKSSK
jgi:hypothetical protein